MRDAAAVARMSAQPNNSGRRAPISVAALVRGGLNERDAQLWVDLCHAEQVDIPAETVAQLEVALREGNREELLRLHAPGAWILRYNMKGEERISLKKDDKVVHIKIFRSDTGARLKPSDKLLPFDTLIQKLIDQETLGTQLTS